MGEAVARHEPNEPAHRPVGEGQETQSSAASTAGVRPAEATQIGFSAASLTTSAITVVVLGAVMFLIFAFQDQFGVGLLTFFLFLMGAGVLYSIAARRRLRAAIVGTLMKDVAEHVGVSNPANLDVDARAWTEGWVGLPAVINIRYPTEVHDTTADWSIGVAEAATRSLGRSYIVGRHKPNHNRVTLRDARRGSGHANHAHRGDAAEETQKSSTLDALPERIDRPIPSEDKLTDWLIPLGVDASGTTVAWNLRNTRGHILTLGRSGAGKRVLLIGLIAEVAARGWPVWVIDHRRVDLLGVRGWPNVQIVASTLADQIVVLHQAWREMEGRITMVESGTSTSDLEPMVVVIHHFREFVASVNEAADRAGQGMGAGSFAIDRITDLLRHGQAVNVFLVLSAQRSDDPLLQEDNRDPLGTVVAMGRVDSSVASRLWGSDGSEALADPVPGRAIVQISDAAPVPVQTYWTPDPREAQRDNSEQDLYLIEALRPRVANHSPLHVRRPRALTDTPAAAWKANMAAELSEGYLAGSSMLDDWSKSSGAAHHTHEATTSSKGASGWSEVVMVSELEPGNLARLDDEHGWVIVEQVDTVEHDSTSIRIHWRGSEGAGSVEMSRTRTIRIRHTKDGIY